MNPQTTLVVLGLASLAAMGFAAFGQEAGFPGDQPQSPPPNGKLLRGAPVVIGPNDPSNPSPGLTLTARAPERKDRLVLPEPEWKKRLTKEQYAILRGHGTEAAFCSPLLDVHVKGVFHCVACGNALFKTDSKFNSGTGWPSFYQPITPDAVWYRLDTGYGMRRTEILCAKCDGHLGHVFDDGPRDKTGWRFCMNGEALKFVPDAK